MPPTCVPNVRRTRDNYDDDDDDTLTALSQRFLLCEYRCVCACRCFPKRFPKTKNTKKKHSCFKNLANVKFVMKYLQIIALRQYGASRKIFFKFSPKTLFSSRRVPRAYQKIKENNANLTLTDWSSVSIENYRWNYYYVERVIRSKRCIHFFCFVFLGFPA